ncbi:hypothetical protein [Mycobacteroides abscessus]|uniref:Uncharacterized protein n=1 Tax=Mycobacteroides abscessus subsp. abscessus TaxID=1185650 RepID=A0AB38CZK5_9MYCO|nr:hypothetical protein [Mycobacteroides abscessus]SHO86228.1 Uncharacterised protein [Mycobacteroides abscessus subsp. abscessus]SHP07871.1 Uncharacterised protein [Mycobacteroides abscessus subsp. abscessus]SHP38720.1 Uncharacterised protein [Mycobacteroides abscessus subsp. abscessus]SHP46923.1 Uncharacterised protein [Mycobacteroides abscessus subsp. abscessus]SHP47423.1 Uncharacterised protein [Mycobacteroides abscessus subsp. abscessus]
MSRSDIPKPVDDPFALVGDSWPTESESAYHDAKVLADNTATTTSILSQSASDAEVRMADERGKTAYSVSGGYGSAAAQLHAQALEYHTISAWMSDAAGSVLSAKRQISALVRSGTSEIRDALNSELSGTPATPSSSELINKYQGEITQVAIKLGVELDGIGHSLAGAPGASRSPSYTSISTTPTPEHADPHVSMASYTGTPGAPAPEPQKLPEMPRAASAPSGTESPSSPSAPSSTTSPHIANPILSNLVAGSTSSSSTPSSTGTSSSKSPSSTTATSTPAGQQAQQPNEQHQNIKSPALPRIASLPLPDLPAAAAESIATAVTSAAAHQLPTAPTTPGSSQAPASTGITPGISGTPPMTPTPPAGLSPMGGLPTPPVVQAPPVTQGTPASQTPGVQAPAPQSPAPAPRGPVADLAWIQRNYGLSPGVELPKSETTSIPALFITDLPENESTLHRVLASIRHQFEAAGWSQPMSAATIRRGLEARTVYATADGLSIHPAGILLPDGVLPLDEVPSRPVALDLHGSLMVTEKLTALIPRTWEVEAVLSTVPGGENSQSAEQFQQLVESGELLECKVSRGRDDVRDDEALRVFARAALGSGGCGELEVESARLRAARWVGVQPVGYRDVLARWYLSDAAESMSRGNWGEAVHSAGKYMSLNQSRSQAA